MKLPIIIICVLWVAALRAAPEEKKQGPAFPSATISIEGSQAEKSLSQVIDIRPATILPGFVGELGVTNVEGSTTLSIDGKSVGEMSWRYIARTEFGDVYIVICTTPEGKKDATALLFDGKTGASAHCGTWHVSIQNK